MAEHPGVDLQRPPTTDLWDGRDPRFDLGLRSGPGGWPGLNRALLATETLTPLCSPAITAVRGWILRLAGGGHGAEEHPEIRRMLDSPPLPP